MSRFDSKCKSQLTIIKKVHALNNIDQTQSQSHQAFAIFGLLFGALAWGLIWYPYRLLSDAGLSGVASSFYTYSLAALIAGIYCFKHWRGVFKLPSSIVWLCLAAGWTNLSYVLAVIDGEVMRVMLLFYLSPLWTLILAHFVLKEKTQPSGYIAIATSLLGAFIMLYNPSISSLPLPRNTAEWMALSAGIGFSVSNVITRQATHLTLRAKSFAIWLGVVTVTLCFVPFMPKGLVAPNHIAGSHWIIILLVALLLIAVTTLVQYGVTKIKATRASVIFLFELVVAAVASYYLANETMAMNEMIGGTLIVLAAIFSASNFED